MNDDKYEIRYWFNQRLVTSYDDAFQQALEDEKQRQDEELKSMHKDRHCYDGEPGVVAQNEIDAIHVKLDIAVKALEKVRKSQFHSVISEGINSGGRYQWSDVERVPWTIATEALEEIRGKK